ASAMCWGKRWRDTKGVLDSIAETVEKKGEVSSDGLPEYFRSRCVKNEAICEAVNRVCSAYAREGLEGANRTVGEYRTVSKLLKSTADMFSEYPERSEELAKRVSSVLDKLEIKYSYVEVRGIPNTVIDAVGVRMEQVPLSAVELVGIFENVLNLRLSEPEFILEGTPTMRLKRRRAISLECAKSACSKKGESVSGDTVSFFENGNGRFYSLICDGMGSGSDAAITSRLASVFLEKLLRCVQDTGVTVELVNRMLLCREDECFTTLDLLEIDLYEKTASFIKAGASTSFIFRDGKCYRINSQTPPAGIIHDLKAEQTTVHLRDGDTIILLSDGILDADDEPELINGSSSEISQEILKLSLLRYSARDDMSVAVIKVLEN
ncbi:MAG: SpoIIE family protein phosphatase, partial [Clostridia bacterium]|nr:SpoIIE family protein phosphatase [Clostridia bacterium]